MSLGNFLIICSLYISNVRSYNGFEVINLMEDFLQREFGNKYADLYRNSTKVEKAEIDLNILTILATGKSKQPVCLKKETVIKDGKAKLRYILEADLELNNNNRK